VVAGGSVGRRIENPPPCDGLAGGIAGRRIKKIYALWAIAGEAARGPLPSRAI
jgi:hypothetical protein